MWLRCTLTLTFSRLASKPKALLCCILMMPATGTPAPSIRALQAVVTIAKSDFPEQGAAALELEELCFLTPEGTLIAEYGLAYALDEQRSSLCTIRLSNGTGFGRLQGQPLTQLMAHVEALQATTAKQPMKTAARRWSDSLLLTAIHFGVILNFFLQA